MRTIHSCSFPHQQPPSLLTWCSPPCRLSSKCPISHHIVTSSPQLHLLEGSPVNLLPEALTHQDKQTQQKTHFSNSLSPFSPNVPASIPALDLTCFYVHGTFPVVVQHSSATIVTQRPPKGNLCIRHQVELTMGKKN